MNPVEVIIHCIGLLLWTSAVPNDPGLHAIMPAVQASRFPAGAEPRMANPEAFTNIQTHTALLIFPAAAILDDSKWPAQQIAAPQQLQQRLQGYRHIRFAGEQVSFITGAPNNTASFTSPMPKMNCGRTRLTPNYHWPYESAAAVIDVPEGEVQACDAGSIAPGRIDATLKLKTAGTLTVIGTKPSDGSVKVLVLKITSPQTLYLANVPLARVINPHLFHETGDKHYLAYWGMVGRNKVTPCSGAPALAANESVPACAPPPFIPTGPGTGTDPNINARFAASQQRTAVALGGPGGRAAGTIAQKIPDNAVLELLTVNSECSNTGWP